jgi:hypothetical protein
MEPKARVSDRDRDATAREEDGKAGATAGATGPVEEDGDTTLEQLLRPKPPMKDRTRGGTGIGRDLDH